MTQGMARFVCILLGLVTSAYAEGTRASAEPSTPFSLSAALEQATSGAARAQSETVARCESSFRQFLDFAQKQLNVLLSKTGISSRTVLLWSVAEDARGSGFALVQPTRRGALRVYYRGGDLLEDNALGAAPSEQFERRWRQVMTGTISETYGVADGSCTLVYDGQTARLFLPGEGVMTDDGDALQAANALLEAAGH